MNRSESDQNPVAEQVPVTGQRTEGRFRGLWRHPDFMRLWIGQTVSEFGSWLGALSLLAILVLDAEPAQMGILETMKAIPVLLLGLFAGVWVDRLRRRPMLIVADIGRALLLLSVVILAFSGNIRMFYLYIVAFLVGTLTMLFQLAYLAYLPGLVERKRLLEANTKVGATASLAEIASPGLGGLLIQLISAPLTLFLDAISYLLSAGAIISIKSREPDPIRTDDQTSTWSEIREGLSLVWNHRLLRTLMAATGTRSFFGGFFGALYSLYVIREVGLSPAILGLLIGAGGIGSLAGAVLTGRFIDQLGWGNALIVSSLLTGLLAFLIPLASGPAWLAMAMLLTGQLIGDVFYTFYSIGEVTLRQSITPDQILGRTNASFEFLVGGLSACGILGGGLVGQLVGLRPATAVAALGLSLAFLWLLFSPLRGMRDPEPWQLVSAPTRTPSGG